MNLPLLIIDSHYLAHRAFHAGGRQLSHRGRATGVIFQFLQSIAHFTDQFETNRLAFCFESSHLSRRELFPEYKSGRQRKLTEVERQARVHLHQQIRDLREDVLPRIGFKNIFWHLGMESDDLMACMAEDLPKTEEAILITSDADLYQCLRFNVSIYSPHRQKLLTLPWFRKTYGIEPHSWAVVKAIAGCKGDGVPGIRGVGEVTALKWVRGDLDMKSKAYQAVAANKEVVLRNRALVELPFVGCPCPKMQPDQVTLKRWQKVCQDYGMKSISGRLPLPGRKAHG